MIMTFLEGIGDNMTTDYEVYERDSDKLLKVFDNKKAAIKYALKQFLINDAQKEYEVWAATGNILIESRARIFETYTGELED